MSNQAAHKIPRQSFSSGAPTDWRKAVAYITGTLDEELLLRREYLSAENRILIQQLVWSNNPKHLPAQSRATTIQGRALVRLVWARG